MSATKKTTTSKKAPAKPAPRKAVARKAGAGKAVARKAVARKPVRKAAAKKSGATLVVRQVRSAIGSNRRQLATLRGLRLGRPGRRSELEDTEAVRGMIRKVVHLVTVEGA